MSGTTNIMRSPNHSESLTDLALRLATQGPLKTLPTPRRIRLLFNGAIIADTLSTSGALYVWEHDYYPQFYLPMEAFVQPDNFTVHMTPGASITDPTTNQIIGGGLKLSVKRISSSSPSSSSSTNTTNTTTATTAVDDASSNTYKHLTDLILFAADLPSPATILRNMVKIKFDAVDAWFEEDVRIHVHPKDPFKRVDLLSCSRPIRILYNDHVLASSASSVHLYETALPVRYYVPLTGVVDCGGTVTLRRSETRSKCPYKGDAEYYDVEVGTEVLRDVCWYYDRPTLECAAVAGLVCFYNEVCDVEFWVGGSWRREERVKTHFI